jgi:serine protease Do
MTPYTNGRSDRPEKMAAGRTALIAGAVTLGLAGLVTGYMLNPDHGTARATVASAVLAPMSFANMVGKVRPAVVSIQVKTKASPASSRQGERFFRRGSPFERFFEEFPGRQFRGRKPRRPGRRPFSSGQGSGFFISADGYLVTNNHVIRKASSVTVITDDGQTYEARIIGRDEKTDLALLKVDGSGSFPHVTFADKDVRVGDWVVAVGNPFGLGGTVTAGIVSARGREIGAGPYDDFIQIDASINRGNSGGPTFDLSGRVVGVNTAIFSPTGGSIGIGFAIPASTAQQIISDLKDDGKVARGWLGVQIQSLTPDIAESLELANERGALVVSTQAGTPAANAGVLPGDVIFKVNGQTVRNPRDLARRIAGIDPGTKIELDIWRGGKARTFTITLGKLPVQKVSADRDDAKPTADPAKILGLSLAPAQEIKAGSQGVAITDIEPDSAAAEKGLRDGDVILDVAGQLVSTPDDVKYEVRQARDAGRKAVLMRVRSRQGIRYVAIPVARS